MYGDITCHYDDINNQHGENMGSMVIVMKLNVHI